MVKAEILYKIHENEDCEKFLWIVRYFYKIHGIDIRPLNIFERLFPDEIRDTVPSIRIYNRYLIGLDKIVDFYERVFNIQNLLEKSGEFRKNNAEYRITDSSTHREK